MKRNIGSFARKLLQDERGQILPYLAAIMVGMIGLGGLSIDAGRGYVAHTQLQNYANAAALAAAGVVYNTSTTNGASSYANNYSASAGDNNVNASLGTVTTTVASECLNMLLPSGSTCTSSSPANAVKVTEAATLHTYFMKLLGFPTLNVSASATASMQGAPQPWNVAIVLDDTDSMTTAQVSSACSGFATNFDCAKGGVVALLQNVNPCGGVSNCTTSTAKFRVALFSFPNLSTSTVSNLWTTCSKPTSEGYTFPSTSLAAYSQVTSTTHPLTYASSPTVATTYEDTPNSTQNSSEDGDANGFVSDYWSATSSNYLNSSSSIVKETAGGCLPETGGKGTYYAGVIYAAQAALTAEQAANPGSKNALIILSDGQAQAGTSDFASGAPKASTGGAPATDYLQLISSPTSTNYYPSATDDCQQAIAAAQTAQSAGTTIYSVAFGSEASGCTGSAGTDSHLWATATSGNPALSLSTLTPCIIMKNLASPPSGNTSYFYADTSSASSGCTDTAHTVSSISQIFDAIAATFTTPRLLPNSASGVVISTTN